MIATGTNVSFLREGAGTSSRKVLIFLPSGPGPEILAGLNRFAEQAQALADQGAVLLLSSPMAVTVSAPFALLPDADGRLAAAFGVDRLPAVFTIDENDTVRYVYDSERYPNLPNPAAVARGLRKLDDAPRPAPISDGDWRLGPDEAAVKLIEYSDYQCGHCQILHAALEPAMLRFPSRVQMVHRHLPLRARHPLAQPAAEAAEAAGAQGKFWEMHGRLFAAAGALSRDQLIACASELGLDVPRFTAELDGRVHEEAVNEDFRRAVAGNIKLPPTLFINGIVYEGPHTTDQLVQAIERLRRSSSM